MDYDKLIDDYLVGPQLLRQAVAGMTPLELDARPIPGKWSTREVICHIADYEPVYADRMKRVIAENEPVISGGSPDAMAARLAYSSRDIEEELALIELVRKQMARILRRFSPRIFNAEAFTTSVAQRRWPNWWSELPVISPSTLPSSRTRGRPWGILCGRVVDFSEAA